MPMSLTAPSGALLLKKFARRRWLSLLIPAGVLVYLIYAATAFDLAGLAGRARLDNAQVLLGDFVSHKTHVARDNRSGAVSVTIEGEAKGRYPTGTAPDWVTLSPDETRVDLGAGHQVIYRPEAVIYEHPEAGPIRLVQGPSGIEVTTRDGVIPEWISASPNRVSLTTDQGRLSYTRSKVETYRYAAGWPAFFFTPESQFFALSWSERIAALWGDRLDPALPNAAAMARDFWNNPMWQHGLVYAAILETLLMAFLGTVIAAIVALPLSFIAARNMMPVMPVRFGLRRIFDFIRGVDGLIWTIVLARAFGPGPMTGALAMALTDTGTFGKTFSEALENIDEKQVEGLRSTGANALQRARFGVIPQVAPMLLSQVLYMFESNTRSATVIGAIVGGGIGLMLTQAIQTQKDWEDVGYYIVLIVLMVIAMDALSGWLRRKLIKGEA